MNVDRVDNPEYIKNGEPIPYQVVSLELCVCQKEAIFAKYNASAGMKPNEQERTFENSVIDDENAQAFKQCENFVDNIETHLQHGRWVYIHGDEERAAKFNKSAYGTGKSHLTHCIGNRLTAIRQKAIYVTEDKLYQDIKSTYRKDSEESESEVIWRYENVPILLIDDMFKTKVTDWVEDKAFHLLDNRLQPGKVTIINSNYSPNRIHTVMPAKGPAISSRIFGQSILIEMVGKDRRKERRLRSVQGGRE